ncbi:MAG: FKBP-type peptidyl-prolyl cis-trans isomerase [Gammaproteobacteria bacterium]|nr:FKBP-type peptidyl-prolyl cis-trans isomerase [Gammaproteobacteria bacterium]
MIRPVFRGTTALVLAGLATLASAADPALTDAASKMSYALGYQLGRDMTSVDIRPDALVKGLQDARSKTKSQLTPDESSALLSDLQKKIAEERARNQAAELEKNAAAGAGFLAENAKSPGVVTTKSGLQYKVITPGTGRKPTASDTVTVNYKGTLVDGTVFDSSYSRGQPASFPVNGVIAGWTEALQLMQEGAKWQVAIPPALAYGDQGPLAKQVLLFEIELLKVGAPEAGK